MYILHKTISKEKVKYTKEAKEVTSVKSVATRGSSSLPNSMRERRDGMMMMMVMMKHTTTIDILSTYVQITITGIETTSKFVDYYEY